MKGPHDGRLQTYYFGRCKERQHEKDFKVEALTLARAVRAFRVGAMFPHQYSPGRRPTSYGAKSDEVVYLSSEPGSKVPIHVQLVARHPYEHVAYEHVADIEPEASDLEAEFGPALVEARRHMNIAAVSLGMEGDSENAGIARAGALAGMQDQPRDAIEQKTLEVMRAKADLEAKKREIEAMRRDLMMQVSEMQAELERRMEQLWMIELFLGSKEEVKVLREGAPAPATTLITVIQQVMCMDEEMAVFDWLENPERIGEFDYRHIDDFDDWLVENPERLEAIFPHQKGLCALRVRRHRKNRGEAQFIGQFAEEEEADRMTYLLVRNGEQLYRLWVDVNMWPRMFSAESDFWATEHRYNFKDKKHEEITKPLVGDALRFMQKKFYAGVLVIQGLLERSTLLHPLPIQGLSAVNHSHSKHFNMVRNGEGHTMIADASDPFANLTWNVYQKWLHEQVGLGVRVQYDPDGYPSSKDRCTWEHMQAPKRVGLYTISEQVTCAWMNGEWSFLYLPDDEVYSDDGWRTSSHKRKVRVRWRAYTSELTPVDYISWRVLEHLIRDRNSRADYADFFVRAFHLWHMKRAEGEQERPFVDLVLTQAGTGLEDEAERARCERLMRWWKVKTKLNRALGDDEPKALRMVLKAFKRGDDHDNDPELALFRQS